MFLELDCIKANAAVWLLSTSIIFTHNIQKLNLELEICITLQTVIFFTIILFYAALF